MSQRLVRYRGWLGLLVALVAVTASVTTLRNIYAQDDIGIVIDDTRLHSPVTWHKLLNETYWPPPYPRDLYRPLTSLLIGAEFWVNEGNPITYKVMQMTLYAAAAIAVFALALRLLPPWGALAAGILFAIHPVHVEAVALAVNQAEVIGGLLAAAAVAWYVGRRRSGPLTPREQAGLAGVTFIAAHFKESGVMLPVLLFATEAFLRTDTWRERIRPVFSLVVWQTLAVALVLWSRSRIEFENVRGTFVAEAFDGLDLWERFLTMLSIVPEWLRLLLWPATLSADYGPRTILPAFTWGTAQTLGLVILLLVAVLAWRVRRTLPVATFGIVWCAAGIFPVSNVIIPTGIPLAERTLFLPSIGAMLAVAAVMVRIPELFPSRRQVLQWGTALVIAVVAVLGISRSQSRHTIWRDSNRMWGQTVIDVPDSYRAYVAFGSLLMRAGYEDAAIDAYARSVELWDQVSGPMWQLAEWLRNLDRCEAAIPYYRRTVELSDFVAARASMVSCLMWLGDYAEAKAYALPAVGTDGYSGIFRVWVRTADSAIRVGAPPRTVRFPPGYDHLFGTSETAVRASR